LYSINSFSFFRNIASFAILFGIINDGPEAQPTEEDLSQGETHINIEHYENHEEHYENSSFWSTVLPWVIITAITLI
jgi:hypothetical protein